MDVGPAADVCIFGIPRIDTLVVGDCFAKTALAELNLAQIKNRFWGEFPAPLAGGGDLFKQRFGFAKLVQFQQ